EVLQGFVIAWQVLEMTALRRGLYLVPFINRGFVAGASMECFHGQAYMFGHVPMLYQRISDRRIIRQRCGICEVLGRKELQIFSNADFCLLIPLRPETTLCF